MLYRLSIHICPNSSIISGVLCPLHNYGESIWCITWTDNMFLADVHYEQLGKCLIHESQDLASVRQHNSRIKAFNKGNTFI